MCIFKRNKFDKKKYIFENELSSEEKNKEILFTKEDFVQEDNKVALTNPFLYTNDDGYLMSIEDFGLEYKKNVLAEKQIVFLRSIVRNDNFTKRKKWKITKEYFKKQKKDYLTISGDLKTKNEQTEENFSMIKRIKVKKIFRLLAFIALFLNVVFFTFYDPFKWDLYGKTFIKDIVYRLTNNFSNVYYLFYGCILATGLYIIYRFLFVNTFMIYVVKQKNAFRRLDSNYKKVIRKFNKSYRTMLKYYKKNIFSKENFFAAYTLEDLWNDKVNYYLLKDITIDIDNIGTKIIKKRRMNKSILVILYLTMFGLNVWLIVKSIIFIINK